MLLVETGLPPSSCLVFQRAVYKDLRWISKSPAHLTHETNIHLLGRLDLLDPLVMLAKDTVRHWTKEWSQACGLPSRDVLQDRWLLLLTPFGESHSVLCWVQFCFFILQEMKVDWPRDDSGRLWEHLVWDWNSRYEGCLCSSS